MIPNRLAPAVPVAPAIDPVWLAVVGSFLVLLGYTATSLWSGVWQQEAYGHGPIVAAIVLWLLLRTERPPLARPSVVAHAAGWLGLLIGIGLYVVGRVVSVPFLEVSGLIPVAAGLLLIAGGAPALRAHWFTLLFLLFLVPLPDFVLEAVTGSLKNKVSYLTEFLLHHAGYPIARSGVVLSVGQYQLLVADACSGLNSLFALTAMGLLYLHLMRYQSVVRNAVLLLAIVPIAIVSNLLRVIALVLLTFHAGDDAGQGFMHGFAGMFLFVVALLMLFGLDRVLGRVPSVAAAERRT